MSTFEPELGQAAFGNTQWQQHDGLAFVHGLHLLGQTIAEVRGDDGWLSSNHGCDPWEGTRFSMRTHCWCDGEDPGHENGCPPNFEATTDTGFRLVICWYKHAARGVSANTAFDAVTWARLVQSCLAEIVGPA